MTNRVSLLYELQGLDSELGVKEEALEAVVVRLGDDWGLEEARSRLAQERHHQAELEHAQRAAEWQADEIRSKLAGVENKLYGGSVGNPRELVSLQEEAHLLKEHQGQEEDRILEIMATVETSQEALKAMARDLAKMEKEWAEEQARLLKEQEELSDELTALRSKRQALINLIPTGDLQLYETLFANKQGKAVVRVERGMCQGCRITLPTRELQRARSGQQFVQCGSCERILYVV